MASRLSALFPFLLFVLLACFIPRGRAIDYDLSRLVGKTPQDFRDDIYTSLFSKPCVRLLGRGGYIGCSGSFSGDSGPLRLLGSVYDIDYFVQHAPLISVTVLLPTPALLTHSTILRLHDTGSVAGIIVLYDGNDADIAGTDLSHAAAIPNQMSSLHPAANYIWNKFTDSLNDVAVDFPILLITDVSGNEVQALLDMVTDGAGGSGSVFDMVDYPRWSATIRNFMHGGDDIETCLSRQTCIPIGGYSLWGHFPPFRGDISGNTSEYVLVTAPLDSNSLFHEDCPAAESAMSSLTALVFAAKALSGYPGIAETKKQILFSLFSGEAFDYIGSRRFASDLHDFRCEEGYDGSSCDIPWIPDMKFTNITLEQIESIIDVGMIGIRPSGGNVAFIHSEHDGTADPLTNRLLNLSVDTNPDILNLQAASVNTSGLPPGASHSFLHVANTTALGKTYPAIAIADHFAEFSTQRYQSSFDTYKVENGVEKGEIETEYICRAALTLAYSILAEAEDLVSPINGTAYNLTVDCDELRTFFACVTYNYTCDVLRDRISNPGPKDINHYPSVHSPANVPNFAHFMQSIMDEATTCETERTACNVSADCDIHSDSSNDSVSFNCIAGKCASSSTYLHPAVPREFKLGVDLFYGVYAWELDTKDPTLPVYAESNWGSELGVEVYKKASASGEFMLTLIGVCLIVLFTSVYLVIAHQKRKID